jgi:hypothetical protein
MRVLFTKLNRIHSETIEIERWIWENDTFGNDKSRFHCNSEAITYTVNCQIYNDDH